MDIVTHGLLGAALGYALSGPEVGKRAAIVSGVAALAPDLDLLIRSSTDPLVALEYHRHFSHSLLFAPVGALIVAVTAWLVMREKFQLSQAIVSALIGYLSAILLDACTSYGTHLFWPFIEGRTSLNIISIIDPIFSGVLLLTLILGISRASRGLTQVGLYFCVCYLCAGYLQNQRAEAVVTARIAAASASVDRIIVKPSFGNIVVWRTLAIKDSNISSNAIRLSVLGEAKVYAGESGTLIDDAGLQRWANGSYKKITEGHRFFKLSDKLILDDPSNPEFLGDARFALLPNSLKPLWGIRNNGPDQSVAYVTRREMSQQTRTQFLDMLIGR